MRASRPAATRAPRPARHACPSARVVTVMRIDPGRVSGPADARRSASRAWPTGSRSPGHGRQAREQDPPCRGRTSATKSRGTYCSCPVRWWAGGDRPQRGVSVVQESAPHERSRERRWFVGATSEQSRQLQTALMGLGGGLGPTRRSATTNAVATAPSCAREPCQRSKPRPFAVLADWRVRRNAGGCPALR